MNENLDKKVESRRNHRIAAGVVLIVLGLAAFLQRWVDVGSYIVLVLGLGMLIWGSVSRRNGWIIPGGVLTGIGLGILAEEGHWFITSVDQGGVFLICFALGWFLIALLTAIFTRLQWWALIPGGIMAVIGGAILATNGALRWEDLNLAYAIILLCLGLFLIGYRGRAKKS
jgi:hypothetical protein